MSKQQKQSEEMVWTACSIQSQMTIKSSQTHMNQTFKSVKTPLTEMYSMKQSDIHKKERSYRVRMRKKRAAGMQHTCLCSNHNKWLAWPYTTVYSFYTYSSHNTDRKPLRVMYNSVLWCYCMVIQFVKRGFVIFFSKLVCKFSEYSILLKSTILWIIFICTFW